MKQLLQQQLPSKVDNSNKNDKLASLNGASFLFWNVVALDCNECIARTIHVLIKFPIIKLNYAALATFALEVACVPTKKFIS
ncbi:MAG: hypothetical protein AAB336_01060 [Acidobacteriota bacterium]